MKTYLFIAALIALTLIWPYWVGGRTRDNVTLICVLAPWVAFWLGYFAK